MVLEYSMVVMVEAVEAVLEMVEITMDPDVRIFEKGHWKEWQISFFGIECRRRECLRNRSDTIFCVAIPYSLTSLELFDKLNKTISDNYN